MQLNNKASGEPATNGFEAWFFGEGDPKAAIVYPQCHFWFSVKNSSKWCGFIKFESIVNNSVSEPVLTDTEEGLVNEEVYFQKSVFSVPFMVGYHDSQFIRITVYDGDQMRLHQGYCMASVKIPLSEVTKATSEFSLCRGDKELAKLYVHTTLDKVTKVMKLFSPDPIISLNFSDTAPDEAKLRKQHEFFNENMNFYVFKFNSPNLIDYDKKFLKSLSGYYFYLKMTKGMKDSDGEIIPAGTKDLWRSRNLDSPPFKLKVGGITRSHEDLTGFVDTRTKPDDLLCLVLELFFVSKDGEEMCVARCDIKLREIIDLPTDEKRTFTGNLVSTYQINPDQDKLSGSNGYEIRSDGISVIDEGLDSEGEFTDLNDEVKTPKSSYSLRSFVSRKLSIRSSASNVNENNSVRECVQKLCKKFGTIQIKVKKQVNLQKVGCGNELYEDRVSAIVEHVRARWYLRLLDVFEQAVFRRRLESIRYIHFLQRINAGWCMKTKIVTDMYHPCLQNIVSQVNRQRGKTSNLLMTSNKSCKVLDVTSLYFSTIQPFLRNQELSAIAGGWITLPSPRFSRFTMDSHFEENGVDIKDKGQNEAIDEYFVRNVGFPIAQEYLACSGSAIQVDDLLPIQIIKSITSWLYGSASKRDGDNEFNLSDLETTQPVNSIFATPNSSDPQYLIRNWAQKVSRDRFYAKRIKYRYVDAFHGIVQKHVNILLSIIILGILVN
jgi:hypothetical protein